MSNGPIQIKHFTEEDFDALERRVYRIYSADGVLLCTFKSVLEAFKYLYENANTRVEAVVLPKEESNV
jgi:hypothetical protein